MKSISWRLLVFFQFMLLIIAFSNCEKELTVPASSIVMKNIELRVMSYNIAFSGGAVDFLYPMWERDGHGYWNRDRTSELSRIIKSVDPDILAIQEAWCWDSDDPKVYVSFANSIGMKYFHYLEYEEVEWNGLCVFSKYPIESTDYLLHQSCVPNQEWNGAYMLKTVIRIDSITTVDILNCHIMFHVPGAQTCEFESLNEYLKDSIQKNTILMGDMNFGYWEGDSTLVYWAQLISETGLIYLSPTLDDSRPSPSSEHNKPRNIDQIWVTWNLFTNYSVYDRWSMENYKESKYLLELLPDASDHYPVIADIQIR